MKLEAQRAKGTVGQIYTEVKVEKKVFGNSYLIKLDGSSLMGMLHKSNIPKQEDLVNADDEDDQANEETKDLSSDDAKKRAIKKAQIAKNSKKKQKKAAAVINTDKDDLLNIGQVISEVRVKEFNFFDGMPILSMLPAVV